jgi:chromate transporter
MLRIRLKRGDSNSTGRIQMVPLNLLFKRFLKLGAVAYGGPAMMGQIKQMVVGEYKWVKESDFLQGMALCQLIPGATMVQMVTYIGYRMRGFWGALLSSIAFVLPASVALVILSALYFKMQTLPFIQVLFKVLGTIVIALILNAGISLGKSILKDWKTVLISVLSFAAFFYKLNILLVFLFAALAALLLRPKINQPKAASPSEKPEQEKKKGKDHLLLGLLAGLILAGLLITYVLDPRLTYLCLILSKIGALAFGGGFTTIPLIQYEMVDRLNWLTTKEFLDGILLGQVTPGPILITSTFVGYKVSGLLGALMATIGVFFPSFFILVLLVPYHDRLRGMKTVRIIEQGILGSFIGMLGLVLVNFGKVSFVNIPSVIFSAAAFAALLKKVGLPYILLGGGIVSILFYIFPSMVSY